MAEPRAENVAIVGMGALFPGAPDAETYWRNIVAGVDAITDVPASRWDASYYRPETASAPSSDRFYCRRGGFIDAASFDPTRFGIMPAAVEGAEPDQLIALQVAGDAIADAGGPDRLPERARVGVIIGRGGYLTPGQARLDQRVRTAHQLVTTLRELLPGIDEAQLNRVRLAFQARLGQARPESSIGLVPNLAASRIANRLDLHGPAYTVDAACASSLVAVDLATRELGSGRCDAVIAGGVHHCHDVTIWSAFTQLGALSATERIRPFHRDADGLLMGEGTGMVVLKRLADAERHGDRVYAVIRGIGVASDGRASSPMRPRPEGQVLALERAWRAMGLDPTEPGAIGLLEAHGTGTPTGDGIELASLTRIFGPARANAEIGIGSVKSMIGHAMPAAGIAGLIKAALAVHHRVLPPTLHCEDPHPALTDTRLVPITQTREWPTSDGSPRRAGLNAFGFGGINAHIVLEEAPGARRRPTRSPAHRAQADEPEPVLLLAGATAEDLTRQLAGDEATLLSRDDARDPPDAGPCRLAIVAPTSRRLELARRIAAQGKPWRGRNDVWFTSAPLLAEPARQTARLAFVFPGLEQAFEPRVDDIADHFGLARPARAGTDGFWQHGLGVIAVGRLLDAALREIGVMPDLVAGHSVGEWTAMIAGGLDRRDAIDAFIASLDPDAFRVPGVVFAALGCGAEQAAPAIEGLDGVVVSHDNCPHQSVICGEEVPVAAALDRLRARGVTGQILPFRSGFHSPMLAPYLGPIRESVGRVQLERADVPVWSATTVAAYPDSPDEVRDLVIRHVVEPVRFGPLVRRLHEEGIRVFVQVGTGSLTGFIDDTLRDREHLALAANHPKRSGLDQLRRAAAALWVEGLAVHFRRLPFAASPPARPRSGDVPAPASGDAMRLDLGAPLVRLGDSVTPLAAGSSPERPAAPGDADIAAVVRGGETAHPVLTELDGALRDATAVARDVLGAWRRSARSRRRATTTLSLETMPFLIDHCFYRQPPAWTDPSDRFPVVPLATTLELMMDAARALVPDRTAIGVQEVRALRWLAVAPPVTVTIDASLEDDGNVKVAIEDYARGTVVMADRHPAPPEIVDRPLTDERPPKVTAEQIYEDRWMFHGASFRGVVELGPTGDDGIRGVLKPSPAPGALLDNAGQLTGVWIDTHHRRDRLALPAAIERVHFYGPQPSPGTPVSCAVRIRSVTDAEVVADIELRTPDGRLSAFVEGWKDRRFDTDDVTLAALRFPEDNRIAEVRQGGWVLARERWRDPATRELIMRCYLDAGERAEYQRRNPRAQRQWLLGRIAVKDAVRQWLWDRGAGPLFPVEIAVRNDEAGRPRVEGPFDAPLQVSLAHTGSLAAAIVGTATPGVGIDIELVLERGARTEAAVLADAEVALLDGLCARGVATDRATWLARFWTAKEAVAKAEGTGLAGRPRRFVVERVDGERLLVAVRPGSGSTERSARPIETRLNRAAARDGAAPSAYAVAWTPVGPPGTKEDGR